MSVLNGGGDGGDDAAFRGRGRPSGGCAPPASSFSLGWGGDEGGASGFAQQGGKRMAGPSEAPSKSAYAHALREQIAARDAQRAAEQWSVPVARYAEPSAERHERAAAVAPRGAKSREASPFAQLGGVLVVDASAKAAAYAQELKAQIDERAASKADARRRRIAAERDEPEQGMFNGHGDAESGPQVEKQRQAEMQRVMAQRADALEQFMTGAGRSGSRGPPGRRGGGNCEDVPAGFARGPPSQQAPRRGLPPRPDSQQFCLG